MDKPEQQSGQPRFEPDPRREQGYRSYGGYGGYGAGYGQGYGQGYGNYGQQGKAGNPVTVYLVMLRERAWWILLLTLVGMAASLLSTYGTMPEYRATGRLRVFRLAPTIAGQNSTVEDSLKILSNDDFFTAVESMRSSAIIEGVSRRLTAAEKKQVIEPYQAGNIFSGPLTEQEVFARQRGITPQRQTLVVNVEFTHRDRDLARHVARLFCEAIQKNSEDERLTIANPLVERARIEIESLEDKVRRLYEQKNELIRSQKLLAIAKDTGTLTAERSVLVKDREEVRKQIDESDIVVRNVAAQRAAGKDVAEIAQVRTDERVSALWTKLTDLKVTVAAMEKKYTDQHPALVLSRTQLEQTRRELDEAVALSVARLDASLQNARARLDAILKNLAAKEDEISRLQAASVELERVDKDIRGSEDFLAKLKLSYEEAKLRSSSSGASTSIRVLDLPSVADKPINKNYYMSGLVGLGVGLALGLGLAVLLGTFDDRIKSARDVEGGLGLPLLGTIPKISQTAGPDRALLARQDKDRMATEAVRALYSSMKIGPASSGGRVFLITSTRPSEGKTFVATNLALLFSQHAERVLVIDADLRLPNVGPSLGFAGDGGLSRWFNGEMTLDEAIVRDVAPGLDVLPVGVSCRNPTQVINHPRFSELLDELRSKYDRVFIDSPPVGAVSDALHLIPKVDGVIYVVRFNLVSLRNAVSCLARLREAGAPLLGVVLNRMSLRMASVYTDSYDASYRKYYVDAPDQGRAR